MQRSAVLIVAALLAACGSEGASSTTVRPASTAAGVDIPARALTAPGSAAEFDGVVVRYYEPAGEGPGFDLRFHDDGSARYEHIGFDPDAPDVISAPYDVDQLGALLDGIEPGDLAAGTHDCMPEVDGSAPRLATVAFEIDYCYAERTDHPLVQLVRSERKRLAAELEDRAEPTDTGSAGPFDRPIDFDGVLARFLMPGGECDRCDFAVTFLANGELGLRASRGDYTSTYASDELATLLTDFDPEAFTTGSTDCGREVDGNAPILEVPDAVIDLCFWTYDAGDPIMALVMAELARVEAERDAAVAGHAIVATVTTVGGLCPTGVCASSMRFHADGTWTDHADGTVSEGTYDPVPLAAAIGAHHVASPILGTFTGTCPTAYDGAEIIYELTEPTTGEVVFEGRTCTDEIDPSHPLILAVETSIATASPANAAPSG